LPYSAAGVLINLKPVDLWTSLYIAHLLVCLLCEVFLSRMPRTSVKLRRGSFYAVAVVLVVRYVLALCLARGMFYLQQNWASWLGLEPNPAVYPSMSFSRYFVYDFIAVLVAFFYQRHLVTSIQFSCVKSDSEGFEMRYHKLADYAQFFRAVSGAADPARIDKGRFSLYGIYRQLGINFERISAFAGLFVLTYSSEQSFPSLPTLCIMLLISLILTQYETLKAENKRKRE
jgi:hypothetical protein